jgi:hypothetical protein
MQDNYGPPGSPQIIHWDGPHEALIADTDGVPIARLSVPPGVEPDLVILREAITPEERDLLARTVAWAVEEHHLKGSAQ